MKIAIDCRFWGLENAGLGRYTMNLVENLAKVDHKNQYFLILREKYFKELKFPKNFKKVSFEERHYSIGEQMRLPKLLQKLDPDLVHFLHFNVPVRYGGKYMVTIHDLSMHKSKGREATTLNAVTYQVKRLGYKKVFGQAVKNSKKIIVPTNYVKEDLLRNYKVSEDKVKVIYEGVDKYKFKSKFKGDSKYFLYVGNAYPHKNLDRLIEAVGHNFNLKIVTPRSVFYERLKEKVEGFENIEILTNVSDGELFGLMADSVGFVYPSLEEGFGLPGLEAMSVGTIVLASDIPVFHEVYKDKVIYFNPFDFTAISGALEDALKMDKEKRGKMIVEGKKFVKSYSWEKMARETLEVYKLVHESGYSL